MFRYDTHTKRNQLRPSHPKTRQDYFDKYTMEISIPIEAKHLVGRVKDEEIILVALIHRLYKLYPEHTWFSMYQYDLYTIVGQTKTGCTPAFVFKNMTSIFRCAYTSNSKCDVSFKKWSGEEMQYKIKRYRNVIVWSYLIDIAGYTEYSTDLPKNEKAGKSAKTGIVNFVRAIKALDEEYNLKTDNTGFDN